MRSFACALTLPQPPRVVRLINDMPAPTGMLKPTPANRQPAAGDSAGRRPTTLARRRGPLEGWLLVDGSKRLEAKMLRP